MDPTDPFGFIDLVRKSKVQKDEEGEIEYSQVVDHAHYQRLLSLGGAQTGIANIRNDQWINDHFSETERNASLDVSGVHVSSFESAANFPLTPFYTQFKDPYEMIPLVHPTDTNFAEEFMMGLWKDANWVNNYSSMPLFGPLSGSADPVNGYVNVRSRSVDDKLNLSSQFSVGIGVENRTIRYNPIDEGIQTDTDVIDTKISRNLIDDSIFYEEDMDFFINHTAKVDGKIAWQTDVTDDQKTDNLYKYLIGKDYVDFLGTYGAGGKFAAAKEALKTINFVQKMFYSILMISSGIFDLAGGWDYNTGTDAEKREKVTADKAITESWAKGNTAKGISDSHMNILSYLTSYIHPVTNALQEMLNNSPDDDAAHGGYVFIDHYDADGNPVYKSIFEMFEEAKESLDDILDANNIMPTIIRNIPTSNVNIPTSFSKRLNVYLKLSNLGTTMFKDLNPSADITDSSFLEKLYFSYGSYYGSGDQADMIKNGVHKNNINTHYLDYTGTSSRGV
ncbi:MAG: hypothetical protein AABZ57_08690, partial [Candidatus Margulisiibacteriota bacterium]